MSTDLAFYVLTILAVVLAGLAKGGLSGVGVLSVPLLALALPPLEATAVMLPILIVQDVVSVWAFRRTWDGRILAVTIPGAAVGVALCYVFASSVPQAIILCALGVMSILFAVQRLWLERAGRIVAGSRSPGWVGGLFGVGAGVTSYIAHAGGPPFQMWVIPRGLSRDSFVGTSALFFAVINWMKVPAYLAVGQFTRSTLTITAWLVPVAIASTFAGVWLVRRIQPERFYRLIYVLLVVVGMKLIFDALR